MTSWEVVATSNEPAELLVCFVAHHLQAGASAVTIFLDAPNPGAQAILAAHPKVRVVGSGPDAWQALHGRPRPGDPRKRQIINGQWAYDRAKSDWIIHLDVDEYLVRIDAIRRYLESAGPDVLSVPIPNAERVTRVGRQGNSVFDGVFRKPFTHPDGWYQRRVWGDASEMLHRGGLAIRMARRFVGVLAG